MTRRFSSMIIVVMLAVLAVPAHAQDRWPYNYPWITWGGISQDFGGPADRREGFLFDFYAKQGVDVARLGPAGFLELYAGLHFKYSSESNDFWNNRLGPMIGVQIRRDFALSETSGWGQIAFGIRGEHEHYYRESMNGTRDGFRGIAYLTFSAGGREGFWKGR